VTHLLIDTSVLLKWFHAEGESEVEPARAILVAHMRGDVVAHVIDLAFYEVGNVLVRALRWEGEAVGDQLDDLREIVGAPLIPGSDSLRDAASLAAEHALSFYDTTWAAVARGLGVTLVSADGALQNAGLAESPTQTVDRLRLGSDR
jgi:predicted nucleic acid-binding protein